MARGPAYPYFDLEKAASLTKKIYEHARKSAAPVDSVIKDVFKMSPSSSSAAKSIAALKYFGLIADAPGASSKQIQLTERALRILFQPEESPERKQALKEAAISPAHYAYCWTKWGKDMQADGAMRAHLILEKHFPDSTVDGFLADYKKTIKYAGLLDDDVQSDYLKPPKSEVGELPSIKIGDYVQWESGGVMQFVSPRKVVSLSADGQYAFVEGSSTGIPTADLVAVTALPSRSKHANPPPPRAPKQEVSTGMQQATIPLAEGDALLQWPKGMSQESYQDFKEWVELMLRRAKRSVVDSTETPNDDGKI